VEGIEFPRRGDVYWANLDPAMGTEMTKTRPVAIVPNDVGNRYSRRVIIAPFTSSGLQRIYPFEVLVSGGEAGVPRSSKIALDQMRAMDKRRLGDRLGALAPDRIEQVDAAIRLTLAV
jgi:mRNA interferase MazF